MTPGHGRLQGLLARLGVPAAAGEQTEPVLQGKRDGGGRHHASAGGRQLNGEWQPVEALTDPSDDLCLGVVGQEAGTDQRRPLGEQLHARRKVQRRHPPRKLTGEAQRLAARRQYRQVGDGPQQLLGQTGGGCKDLFAIVEHEQRFLTRQELGHRLDQGSLGLGAHIHRMGDGGRHQLGVGDTGELDPPRAARVPIGDLGRQLQGEAGLAAATGAAQRDQAMSRQQVSQLGHLHLAADERRQLGGQVVGEGVE